MGIRGHRARPSRSQRLEMRALGTANLKSRQRGHFNERSSNAGGCHPPRARPVRPAAASPHRRRSFAERARESCARRQAGSTARKRRGPEPTDQPALRAAAQAPTAESENVNFPQYGQLGKWIPARPPHRAGAPQARSRQDGGAGGRLPRMRGPGRRGQAAERREGLSRAAPPPREWPWPGVSWLLCRVADGNVLFCLLPRASRPPQLCVRF